MMEVNIDKLTAEFLRQTYDEMNFPKKPPKEAFTYYDWLEANKENNVSIDQARHQIQEAIDRGKIREWGLYQNKKYFIGVKEEEHG